jgi:hypothetical protein
VDGDSRMMNNVEAIEILEDMKVKIDIQNAAVTQRKRNEALEIGIKAIAHCEYMDAVWREVCKTMSTPTPSGYPILPKTVIEEMQHPGKPDDDSDPPYVCRLDVGAKLENTK